MAKDTDAAATIEADFLHDLEEHTEKGEELKRRLQNLDPKMFKLKSLEQISAHGDTMCDSGTEICFISDTTITHLNSKKVEKKPIPGDSRPLQERLVGARQ